MKLAMLGIARSFALPKALVEQLDREADQHGYVREQLVAAAIAGFLRLSPGKQRAALEAVTHYFPPPPVRQPRRRRPYQPHPRKKFSESGKAVRLQIRNPDRIIG